VTSPPDYNWREHNWRNAAARAEFAFYRPSEPEPSTIWAGGHGRDRDPGVRRTTHLGVHARIGGCEVSVDTAANEHRFDRRLLVMNEIDAFVLNDADPIELPWTIQVVAEPRTIEIDGVPFEFDGVRVVGGTRWSGAAAIGEVHVNVTTEDPIVVTAIERCTDLDLPDFEPRA